MAIPALRHIRSGIWASLGKLGSNNGIVRTAAGIVLIDVPHRPTDAIELAKVLDSWGTVVWIVHTDHHIDHTLTNGFFPGTVAAHRGTYDQLANMMPTVTFVDELLTTLDPGGRDLIKRYPERVPDVAFTQQLTLHLGGTAIDLLALPGHTPNTIGIHIPAEGVLFSGDVVSGMGLPSSQESSFRACRAAIETVLGLDFDVLVPGHGEVGDRSTVIRYRNQLDELVDRVDQSRLAGMSMDEAAERIRYEDLLHVSTDTYQGYPPEMVEEFQRRSIRSIFAELERGDDAGGPFVWGDGTGGEQVAGVQSVTSKEGTT